MLPWIELFFQSVIPEPAPPGNLDRNKILEPRTNLLNLKPSNLCFMTLFIGSDAY